MTSDVCQLPKRIPETLDNPWTEQVPKPVQFCPQCPVLVSLHPPATRWRGLTGLPGLGLNIGRVMQQAILVRLRENIDVGGMNTADRDLDSS